MGGKEIPHLFNVIILTDLFITSTSVAGIVCFSDLIAVKLTGDWALLALASFSLTRCNILTSETNLYQTVMKCLSFSLFCSYISQASAFHPIGGQWMISALHLGKKRITLPTYWVLQSFVRYPDSLNNEHPQHGIISLLGCILIFIAHYHELLGLYIYI